MPPAMRRPPLSRYYRSWLFWGVFGISQLWAGSLVFVLLNGFRDQAVIGLALVVIEVVFILGLRPKPSPGRGVLKWLGTLGLLMGLSVLLVYLLASALLNILNGDGPNIIAVFHGAAALIALVGTFYLARHPAWTVYPYASRSTLITAAVALLLGIAVNSGHRLFHSELADWQPSDNFAIVDFQSDGHLWYLPLKLHPGPQELMFWNHDFSWHTFTIDSLGVNVLLPYDADRLLHLNAPPGVYEFCCAIPGHREAGEVGTLTVTEPAAAPPN